MKRLRLLSFFFYLCCLSLPTMSQTQYFYTSDKLSSNQITQICRDQIGYIWVGTEFGLNKYDGYRFTNYFHETDNATTISSNVISFLFVDSRGNLWVGTQKGLDRYDDANDQFIHVGLEGATAMTAVRSWKAMPRAIPTISAISLSMKRALFGNLAMVVLSAGGILTVR